MASLVLTDAFVKMASQTLPTSQVLFVRNLCALAFLVVLGVACRARIRLDAFSDRQLLARSALDAAAGLCSVLGIVHSQLAIATAVSMTSPLIMAAISVMVYGQKLSVRQWLAVIAGFVGVLLMVQPNGEELDAWVFVMLAGAALSACRDLLTARMRKDIPSLQITWMTVATTTVISALWGLCQEWRPVTAPAVTLLASAGAGLTVGFFLNIVALRTGDIRWVAQLRYSALVFAAPLGYLLWGYVPGLSAWVGMALIVLAGAGMLSVR